MADETCEVLVVGGSMVGLAAALFLAQQGIRPVLVERQPTISAHPRAQATSPRTMELMRAHGLADAVRARENPHARYGDILQVESLTGAELGRFDGPLRHDPNDVAAIGWTLIGQDRLEPVLRARAEELGADLRFGTELTGFSQDADGVDVVLRDLASGAERSVRARYMIAADGVHAGVRDRLGIGAHGPGRFGRQMNVVFHADLDPYVGDRSFFLCFVSNPKVRGVLGRLGGDGSDRWTLAPSVAAESSHLEYSEADCVELVRAAVGVPDLEVAVESSTSWEIVARIADRFRSGRVLLAGDCAHLMPPTGGFGGNMGVQDAHNLAWKLALVLRGLAGAELLDSYEQERAPVAEFTVEQGVIRYLQRSGLDEAVAARHRPESTVLFGHVYRSNAVRPDVGNAAGAVGTDGNDGTEVAAESAVAAAPDDGAPVEDPTRPSGRPGTRAPHLLVRGGTPLHDLLDGGFLLLAGPDGAAWRAAAAAAALPGMRLDFLQVGTDGDVSAVERFRTAYGLDGSGAALIRPDGFIGWRSARLPSSPGAALRDALDGLLHRVPVGAVQD